MVIFPQRKEWVTRVRWINVPVYFETPKPLSRALNPPVCNSVKPWCDWRAERGHQTHRWCFRASASGSCSVVYVPWKLESSAPWLTSEINWTVSAEKDVCYLDCLVSFHTYAESTRRAFLYFEAQSFLGAGYPWENTLWGFSCISFLLICPIIETFLRARWVVGILWSFPLLRSQSPPRI